MTTYTKTGTDGTSISVTFTGEMQWRVMHDKTIMVRPNPGSSVVVQSYTPAWNPTTKRHGAMKHPTGFRGPSECDVDGRLASSPPSGYGKRTDVPVALIPGDVLVICKSHGDFVDYYTRTSYLLQSAHSYIDQMLCIQCVDFDIGPSQPAMLRPPAIGISSLAFQMRGAPILESQIDMSKLPSVIDLAAVGTAASITMPSISTLQAFFAEFCGEFANEWGTHYLTPGLQHPGYGSYLSGIVSDALVYLCSTLTPAQKLPLARSMVQWGLDLAGAWVDNRVQYPLGGHAQGRKALIILAGKLLGSWPLENPSQFFPGDPNQRFQEDGGYFSANPAWWFGWQYGWRMGKENSFSSSLPPNTSRGDLLAVEPLVNEWGNPEDPEHLAWAWKLKYMDQCCGSQVGTVLAATLMGMRSQFGGDMCGMVDQFMEGPGAGPIATLAAYQTGITVQWGRAYSVGPGDGKISQYAYSLYR